MTDERDSLTGNRPHRLHRLDRNGGRVAVLSLHTSPLDQPGTGDAGGMNVYVAQTAARLAAAGHRGRDLHQGDLVGPPPPGSS